MFKGYQRNIIPPKYRFAAQKVPGWHWCCLSQCIVTDKNQLLFFYVFFFLEATELLRFETKNWSKFSSYSFSDCPYA